MIGVARGDAIEGSIGVIQVSGHHQNVPLHLLLGSCIVQRIRMRTTFAQSLRAECKATATRVRDKTPCSKRPRSKLHSSIEPSDYRTVSDHLRADTRERLG